MCQVARFTRLDFFWGENIHFVLFGCPSCQIMGRPLSGSEIAGPMLVILEMDYWRNSVG